MPRSLQADKQHLRTLVWRKVSLAPLGWERSLRHCPMLHLRRGAAPPHWRMHTPLHHSCNHW